MNFGSSFASFKSALARIFFSPIYFPYQFQRLAIFEVGGLNDLHEIAILCIIQQFAMAKSTKCVKKFVVRFFVGIEQRCLPHRFVPPMYAL